MGWVMPRVGLGTVGMGWVDIFYFWWVGLVVGHRNGRSPKVKNCYIHWIYWHWWPWRK